MNRIELWQLREDIEIITKWLDELSKRIVEVRGAALPEALAVITSERS